MIYNKVNYFLLDCIFKEILKNSRNLWLHRLWDDYTEIKCIILRSFHQAFEGIPTTRRLGVLYHIQGDKVTFQRVIDRLPALPLSSGLILWVNYSERINKVVIARSEATWQSHEIASRSLPWAKWVDSSLRSEWQEAKGSQWHHANTNLFMAFTIKGLQNIFNRIQ